MEYNKLDISLLWRVADLKSPVASSVLPCVNMRANVTVLATTCTHNPKLSSHMHMAIVGRQDNKKGKWAVIHLFNNPSFTP